MLKNINILREYKSNAQSSYKFFAPILKEIILIKNYKIANLKNILN